MLVTERDLTVSHGHLLAGQDCANLGSVPLARGPTGTGRQTAARPERRLAQSGPAGMLSSALVAAKALHLSSKSLDAPHRAGFDSFTRRW